jgi:hypothetical protein
MKPYTWRAAILKSGLPATTRHVLLTLSLYINDVGQSAYPSIKRLSEDTGLTERAVLQHLQKARDAGWLVIGKHGFSGQKWAANEYFPMLPDGEEYVEKSIERDEPGSPLKPQGVNDVHARGEPRSGQGVNDVPTNNPYELSRELSILNNKKSEILKTKPETFNPKSYLQNLGVDDQTIVDWLAHRKNKKASASMTVISSRIEEAGKAGMSLSNALKLEISRNWQGFDASWLAPKQQPTSRIPNQDRRTSDNEEAKRLLFGNRTPEVIDV